MYLSQMKDWKKIAEGEREATSEELRGLCTDYAASVLSDTERQALKPVIEIQAVKMLIKKADDVIALQTKKAKLNSEIKQKMQAYTETNLYTHYNEASNLQKEIGQLELEINKLMSGCQVICDRVKQLMNIEFVPRSFNIVIQFNEQNLKQNTYLAELHATYFANKFEASETEESSQTNTSITPYQQLRVS